MAQKPKDFFIVPDKKFVEATKLSSTSTGGARPTTGAADATNSGNLSVYLSGTPTTTFTGFDFKIQDSGSVNSTSFVKKYDADSEYKGEPDRRFRYNFGNPMQTTNSASAQYLPFGYGATAVYCSKNQREYVYCAKPQANSGKILYAYRGIDTDSYYGGSVNTVWGDDTWTTGEINLTTAPLYRGIQFPDFESCQIDVCAMEDGKLKMAVFYNYDLDLYESEDGTTWTVVGEKLLSRFLDRRADLRNMRIAQSGGYIKIIFAEITGAYGNGYITGMISSDGGATWVLTDQGNIKGGVMAGAGLDPYSFDMCGLGGSTGAFLMINKTVIHAMTGFTKIRSFISYGTNTFSALENLDITPLNSYGNNFIYPRLLLCEGQDWIWLWMDCCEGVTIQQQSGTIFAGKEHRMLYIPKSSDISSSTWTDLSINERQNGLGYVSEYASTGYYGALKYRIGRGKFYACADGVAIFGSMWDSESAVCSYKRAPVYYRFSGWQANPPSQYYDDEQYSVASLPRNPYQPSGRVFLPEWDTSAGSINTLYASSVNQWSATRTLTTSSYTTSRLRLTDNTMAAGQQYDFSFTHPQTIRFPIWYNGQQINGPVSTASHNWMFASTGLSGPFGSCAEWICRVDDDGFAGTNNDHGGFVQMMGFIEGQYSSTGQGHHVKVSCHMSSSGFTVIDENDSSAVLASVSLSANELRDNWYEFRWAFRPGNLTWTSHNWGIPGQVSNPTLTAPNVLAYRKYGTDTWNSTAILSPATTQASPLSSQYKQQVSFGHAFKVSPAATARKTYWKRVAVSNGDLQQFYQLGKVATKPRANAVRGRVLASDGIYVGRGMTALWGGVGGFEGDTFSANIEYDYDVTNANKFSSPRTKYASEDNLAASEVSFILQPSSGHFSHNAAAFFGVVGTTLIIDYSDSSNFTSYTTAKTLSMKVKTGEISAASGGSITMAWDGFNPQVSEYTASRKSWFYALVKNGAGEFTTGQVFKIDEMFDATRLMMAGASNLTGASVGTSIEIYANRNYAVYSDWYNGKYMRITLQGSKDFPEKRAEIGTAIVGSTLTLDVPLDWSWKDDEKPNVKSYKTRGGVSWGYTEGPSVRSLSAKMLGDVSQQNRREIRQRLRRATDYSQFPMVFVQDVGLFDAERIVLCRYEDGTNMDNQGWYYDSNSSLWMPVGDLSLTFLEVV